jgi:hypothetical protein
MPARKIPGGLPPTLNISELVYLLDITSNRISQLTTDQVIQRASTGKYSTSSVPNYIRFLRQSGSGPATISQARGNLAIEKAALARMKRMELEGSLVPVDQVAFVYGRTFSVIKNRALSMPAKIAAKLGMCQTAAEAQKIVRDEVEEFLRDAAQGKVRFGGKYSSHRKRSSNGNGRDVDVRREPMENLNDQ